MADLYNAIPGTDLVVPVKAATIFAAHESSLFLGGAMIPVVSAPNGLLKVPVITGGTAYKLSTVAGAGSATDISVAAISDATVDLVCDLYAARTVVRDLGAIDPTEIGRQLGNKISASFDADVAAALATLTAGTADNDSRINDVFKSVGAIRAAGETGQLYGVVSADQYATFMTAIGSTAYAGGDVFQGAALRSGFLGNIAGVQMFVSSYMTDGLAIFGADALRIAMQKNVDVEIARRAEAVGNDVVASLHAKVGVVDATRGVFVDYS